VVDLPTPPFWLATAITRRIPFKVSRWIRNVTLAFLAADSMSIVSSALGSATVKPSAIGFVSRETSTPASAAARDTASRTAIAASSSDSLSSSAGSISSPPSTDVSRETSSPVPAGAPWRSTSPASVDLTTVDMLARLAPLSPPSGREAAAGPIGRSAPSAPRGPVSSCSLGLLSVSDSLVVTSTIGGG